MKKLYIDADTILYSSASQQQKTRCVATHTPTQRVKQFDSKTDFNNWLKENPKWKKEDFTFEAVYELFANETMTRDSLSDEEFYEKCKVFAFHSIKEKIANIVEKVGIKDYYVCIQGEGNFRKDYQSFYVQYKAHRPPKPLLFQECFDFVVKKYGKRCIVVEGQETDDYVCQKAFESQDNVIAFVDKDIPANLANAYLFNYFKPDDGIFFNDENTQARLFCEQWLKGDTADNIDGVLKLSDAIKEKYGVKGSGVGDIAAKKLLDGCNTPSECYARVREVYASSWPEDWRQRMYDNGYFLYLRRTPGDVFDLAKFVGG